jgi:hypothetical protein
MPLCYNTPMAIRQVSERVRVRLKADAFPGLEQREWIVVANLKKGTILLIHPEKNYTIEVNPEDIE